MSVSPYKGQKGTQQTKTTGLVEPIFYCGKQIMSKMTNKIIYIVSSKKKKIKQKYEKTEI